MLGRIYSFIILLFWIYVMFRLTNKRNSIIIGVVLGIVSASFALLPIIQDTVNFCFPQNDLEIISPFLEEIIKFSFIFIYSIIISENVNNVTLLGASSGLGFAFVETFSLYHEFPSAVIMRGYTSFPIHILTAFVSSYGISQYYSKNGKKWILLFIVSFIIHYSYNVFIAPLLVPIYI